MVERHRDTELCLYRVKCLKTLDITVSVDESVGRVVYNNEKSGHPFSQLTGRGVEGVDTLPGTLS